jgi:cell division protein FtsL
MIRPGTVLWLLLVMAVGYAMFQVKYEVMQQEDTLARINKEIADTRDQIRVLDAEWNYLSQPSRLKRLAARYLDLSPINAAEIVELSAVPERSEAPPAAAANHDAKPATPKRPTQSMPSQTAELRIAPTRKDSAP